MKSISERIAEIEKEIRETPYHKGTEHHIGKLKAKLAKLREEEMEVSLKKGGGGGYAIKKSGDATVVLVGPPSVGKSTLLNKLTNAQSKVGDYDFTTLEVVPGMLDYNGARIQILDIPGLIEGASLGKGRGREVISVARVADLILIIVDYSTVEKIELIKNELYRTGIRLDQTKPKIDIKRNASGGIRINSSAPLSLDVNLIRNLALEFGLRNGEIFIRESVSIDQVIDALSANRVYIPSLVVVNKIDRELPKLTNKDWVYISAEKNLNLDVLKSKIWNKLGLKRVFLKKGEEIDLEEPLIVKEYLNLKEILEKISIEGKHDIKKAKIYGPGAKFPGQEVSLDFVPQDGTGVWFSN